MKNVTDLGDINDKCVRQDANVPDATAQRSAVGDQWVSMVARDDGS